MKFLVSLSILFCAAFAAADTLDTRTFLFDGNEQTFALRAEETHTEYRYETVARTCWRDEFAGYRRECHWVSDRRCHNERECRVVNGRRECWDRPVCHDHGRHVCHDVPYYRRVAYTCYDQIRIPYEVRDFNVNANVRVAMDPALSQRVLRESMRIDLKGDQLSLRAMDKESRWVLFFERSYNEHLAGGLKTIEAIFTLRPLELSALDQPLSEAPSDIKVAEGEKLSFRVKGMTTPELFDVKVLVKKTKFLASEKLVDTVLPATAFEAVQMGGHTGFSTRLADLGWDPRAAEKGSYKLEVTLMMRVDRNAVLNDHVLPKKTEVTGTGKHKVK